VPAACPTGADNYITCAGAERSLSPGLGYSSPRSPASPAPWAPRGAGSRPLSTPGNPAPRRADRPSTGPQARPSSGQPQSLAGAALPGSGRLGERRSRPSAARPRHVSRAGSHMGTAPRPRADPDPDLGGQRLPGFGPLSLITQRPCTAAAVFIRWQSTRPGSGRTGAVALLLPSGPDVSAPWLAAERSHGWARRRRAGAVRPRSGPRG
jgi:hypothetical protein